MSIDMRDEDRITAVEVQLEEIRETLAFIKETIVKADTTISAVAEQVMPTVNMLMDHPMLKMLVGKK